MKRSVVLIFMLLVCSRLGVQAAELKVTLPAGSKDAIVISSGTQAVLAHLRAGLASRMAELDRLFGISGLEKEKIDLEAAVADDTKSRKKRLDQLREDYLGKLDLEIHSASAEISLQSSALGQIFFTYTITNRSDRTIAYLHYDPVAGSINIPTSSRLILELIDFESMLFGLAPGKTLSNIKTTPEQFAFFAAELTPEQIDFLNKSIGRELRLHVSDLTFVDRVDYKGQARVLSLDEAFASELAALDRRISSNTAALEKKNQLLKDARSRHAKEKEQLLGDFVAETERLKAAAIRCRSVSDKSDAFVFEELAPGHYIVYAKFPGDRAVFEEVSIEKDGRTNLSLTTTRKDPFTP